MKKLASLIVRYDSYRAWEEGTGHRSHGRLASLIRAYRDAYGTRS